MIRFILLVWLLLAIGTSVSLADFQVGDHTWSGYWSVGGDIKTQGVAYDIDTGYTVADFPLVEKVNHFGLNLEKIEFHYDFLLGVTDEGQEAVLGAGLSLNVCDGHFHAKAGLGIDTDSRVFGYVGIGLKF